MPHSRKEGILLSIIMSLIMIYVMAALNECVKSGAFSGEAWIVSLKRLPLGFAVGIICDMAHMPAAVKEACGRGFKRG